MKKERIGEYNGLMLAMAVLELELYKYRVPKKLFPNLQKAIKERAQRVYNGELAVDMTDELQVPLIQAYSASMTDAQWARVRERARQPKWKYTPIKWRKPEAL